MQSVVMVDGDKGKVYVNKDVVINKSKNRRNTSILTKMEEFGRRNVFILLGKNTRELTEFWGRRSIEGKSYFSMIFHFLFIPEKHNLKISNI